ncbi:hypothetical protein SMBr_28170 [Shewanella sp. M-Br]|nr:hypothetical protein SMBr_28170 [Shewanella sp. M-Br]
MALCFCFISDLYLAYKIKVSVNARTIKMLNETKKYGVNIVERPHVKANKKLDLTGGCGKQIVHSETKLVLRTHKNTFRKLADM